jgi:uncharacterized membrane protein
MPVILRRAFVAASLAWAALLVLVPFLASRTHASPLGTALVVAAYSVGSLVCHQLPERSYRLWTAQMPVCARCAGIYFGAALSAVAARWRQPSAGAARSAVAAAVAPSLATLVYEWTTGITPSNALRFLAGIPIGVVVAWLVVSAAKNQVN